MGGVGDWVRLEQLPWLSVGCTERFGEFGEVLGRSGQLVRFELANGRMNGMESSAAFNWSELGVCPGWCDSMVACALSCEEWLRSAIFGELTCICGNRFR